MFAKAYFRDVLRIMTQSFRKCVLHSKDPTLQKLAMGSIFHNIETSPRFAANEKIKSSSNTIFAISYCLLFLACTPAFSMSLAFSF